MCEKAIFFIFSGLWVILDHIYGTRKDKAYSPPFVFLRRISNAICDLPVMELFENLCLILHTSGGT